MSAWSTLLEVTWSSFGSLGLWGWGWMHGFDFLFGLEAAEDHDLVIALKGLESGVSGTDHVEGGTGTIDFGNDVLDAGELKDGADGATSDDTCASWSWFEDDFGGGPAAFDFVSDGAFDKVDALEVLLSSG